MCHDKLLVVCINLLILFKIISHCVSILSCMKIMNSWANFLFGGGPLYMRQLCYSVCKMSFIKEPYSNFPVAAKMNIMLLCSECVMNFSLKIIYYTNIICTSSITSIELSPNSSLYYLCTHLYFLKCCIC